MKLLDTIRRWHVRRMTVRQLRELDDHILKDIGLERYEILFVAEQMAKVISASDQGRGKSANLRVLGNSALRRFQRRNPAIRGNGRDATAARLIPLDHRHLPARRRQVDCPSSSHRTETSNPEIKECC